MKPTVGRYQIEIRFRVKVLRLEKFNIERADSVHLLEGRINHSAKVRNDIEEPVAGKPHGGFCGGRRIPHDI